MAQAGLAAVHDTFEFGRDGVTMPLRVAMDGSTFTDTLETGMVRGTGQSVEGFEGPYNGRSLADKELLEMPHAQVDKGTMDASLPVAVERLQRNPQWLDLSDKYLVLIGATSEMGHQVSTFKVQTIGIARPSPKWAELLEAARASAGTFTYPICDGSEGADAMTATPELANWLTSLYPDKQLIVYSGIYQDGEAFVRASVAMDAIVASLAQRRVIPPALAYIDTPTHVHVVPEHCATLSSTYYNERTGWQKVLQFVSGARLLRPVEYSKSPQGCSWCARQLLLFVDGGQIEL